jgi:YD repeat-containing protein
MTATQTPGCGTISERAVSTWASFDDFLAEVAVIPGRETRSRLDAMTTACDGSRSTATGSFSYDAQRRLVSWTVQTTGATPTRTVSTTVATDASLRPTSTSTSVVTTLPDQTVPYTTASLFTDPARTETRTLPVAEPTATALLSILGNIPGHI